MPEVTRSTSSQSFSEAFLRHPWLYGSATAALLLGLWAWGCRSRQTRVFDDSISGVQNTQSSLLGSVTSNLNSLEDVLPTQMDTIIDRLNQWLRQQNVSDNWSLDPLVADTYKRDHEYAQFLLSLSDLHYHSYDGWTLQEAVWLHDISENVKRPGMSDLDLATALFDWTIRNIQVEDEAQRCSDESWKTLLYGRGEHTNRAWVFCLLARQQGLQVCMLAYQNGDGDRQPWIPALLHDGKLYLFEHKLGLPIPGPAGAKVATLGQVRKDDSLLRQLDVEPDRSYPLHASDLTKVAALIEASPQYLSRRMQVLQKRLAGKKKIVLTVDPTRLALKFKECPTVDEVRIWDWPYQCMLNYRNLSEESQNASWSRFDRFLLGMLDTVGQRDESMKKELPEYMRQLVMGREQEKYGNMTEEQRQRAAFHKTFKFVPGVLWKARMLSFRGELTGDDAAAHFFQLARPTDAQLQSLRGQANQLRQRQAARRDATYWLGLLAYQRGEYATAAQYFREQVLARDPDGPWSRGARYNLARSLEALGDSQQAIAVYETDPSPLQRHGSLLRARTLRQRLANQSTGPDSSGKSPQTNQGIPAPAEDGS